MIGFSPITGVVIKKVVFCGFVTAIFLRLFLLTSPNAGFPEVSRTERYLIFNVMPISYPGFDARNIQVAAYCADQGFSFFGRNTCMQSASPVKAVHEHASVPVLNYPSLWPRAYRLFHDYSEAFFMRFWHLNAFLLIAAFFILSMKYNHLALPLFLFSPISLLAVERGNTDAATFFVTFAPLILCSGSLRLQSFFLAVAATMKIFPLCGFAALVGRTPPFLKKDVLLGAVAVSPFLLLSLSEVPEFIRGTDQGFSASFGLLSPSKLEFFADRQGLAAIVLGSFVAACAAAWIAAWRKGGIRGYIRGFERLETNDLIVFLVSVSIFLGTFFLFVSWSYRLIFVAPAFFVLSKVPGAMSRVICVIILAIFWVPLFPTGWDISNLLCFPLALILGIAAFACWDILSRRTMERAESNAVAAERLAH